MKDTNWIARVAAKKVGDKLTVGESQPSSSKSRERQQ